MKLLISTIVIFVLGLTSAQASYVPPMGSLVAPFEYLNSKETKVIRKSVKIKKLVKSYVKPLPLNTILYDRNLGASGKASYYWQGQRTANGEVFKPDGISCAHKTLPFNTRIRVTNLHNGKSVVCRVNDRGPFIAGRVVDVSRGAARVLGMIQQGVVPVSIDII